MKLIIVYTLLFSATVWADRMSSKSNISLNLGLKRQNFQVNPKIAGGNEAVPHSIPYQVAIEYVQKVDKLVCGGSLISRKYVLTAAHCVDDAKYVRVALGAHNITKLDEPGRMMFDIDLSKIVIHEDFNSDSYANDIAIIELPEVTLSDSIKIVKLPKRWEAEESFKGRIARASGWGVTGDSETQISSVLQYVDLPVISNFLCNLFFLSLIEDTNICTAGWDEKSTCVFDDGGPLVVGGNKLIGVESYVFHYGCQLLWPAVFTRVSKYLDWIEANSDVKIQKETI